MSADIIILPTVRVERGGYIYRAGDVVHHEPTNEDWVVAYVDGEYLAWCGWPAGEAKAADCWLKKSCTDAEHHDWLLRILNSDGKRARMARRALDALGAAQLLDNNLTGATANDPGSCPKT